MKVIRIVTYIGDQDWVEKTLQHSLSDKGLDHPVGMIEIATIRDQADLDDAKETILKDW